MLPYVKAEFPLPKEFPFRFFDASGVKSAKTGEEQREPTLHFHDCLELNYVAEGSGINHIGDQRFELRPGDLYVINSIEHHMAVQGDHLRLKVIIFDPKLIWQNASFDYEYLRPFFHRSLHFSHRVGGSNPLSREIGEIFLRIETEEQTQAEGYQMVIKAKLMELLALLYRHYKANGSIGGDVRAFYQSYDRLRGVIDHIHAQPSPDLSLETLAGIACMNKTYFSTFFKKVMHINVTEYICQARLARAAMLLKTTHQKVLDISLDCGFQSVTHFNRTFRQHYSVSPGEYRRS